MKRFVGFLFLVYLAAAAGAGDWPQWGGPNRDFTAPDPGLAAGWPKGGPSELWRAELGDGYSGIVVAGEQLFTMLRDGTEDSLVALHAQTGRLLWRHSWEAQSRGFMDLEFGPGPHSTPAVSEGRVFGIGSTGHLVAVDRKTGEELWSRELWDELDGTRLERGYAASPLIFEDLLVVPVGGPGKALVAFRQSDGAIAWQRLDHGVAYASPILAAVGGETQLVALLDKVVLGLDPRSGEQYWSFPVTDYRYINVASPLYSEDGLLFLVTSEGGRVLRLDGSGRETLVTELWVGKSIGSQVGNAVRFGDYLYGTRGASASKYVSAVDVRTGELAWRDRQLGDCSILKVGSRALVLESGGTLHLARFTPEGIAVEAEAQILSGRSWTAPALAGTRLFLRDRSEIVAVELGHGAEAASD